MFFFALAICVQAAPTPPSGLTVQWSEGSGVNRTITLSWSDNAVDETGYVVERKIGAGAWADLAGATALPANTTSHADTVVPRAPTTHTAYFYRVRAKGAGTVESGAAEVCTAGIPNTGVYDTDADGIVDSLETPEQLGLNPNDWADGSGDKDGDGVPNAWEVNMGSNPLDPASVPGTNIVEGGVSKLATVTVDPSATPDASTTTTITAAIAKFATTTTHTLNSYRVIRVKPGIYNENVSKAAAIHCHIAIVPLRSHASDYFEICGTSSAAPVVSTFGSLVMEGFVLNRAAGTRGRVISVNEEAIPLNRISQVRFVNCLVSNVDSGPDAVLEQSRSRLVLSHCTFFMNAADTGALAHSYSAGLLGTTAPLESTARLKVHNSILWNPINTSVPEFQSAGEFQFVTSVMYQSTLAGMPLIPAGTEHLNPGLTPKGYIASAASPVTQGGTAGLQVLKDMHGEMRFQPPLTGRGADEWDDGLFDEQTLTWTDGDGDGIPTFADTMPNSTANTFLDNDGDLLSELMEYLGSTDVYSADSTYYEMNQMYLTKEQTFDLFYRKAESDARYFTKAEADDRFLLRTDVLRVQPQGGLSMGDFTNGSLP